jgi:hypothetical protein
MAATFSIFQHLPGSSFVLRSFSRRDQGNRSLPGWNILSSFSGVHSSQPRALCRACFSCVGLDGNLQNSRLPSIAIGRGLGSPGSLSSFQHLARGQELRKEKSRNIPSRKSCVAMAGSSPSKPRKILFVCLGKDAVHCFIASWKYPRGGLPPQC